MGIWLAMATVDGLERLYAVDRARIVIGREARCDVRVPLRNVAQKHCELIVQRGRLRVRDLGSEFGTFVNGERISDRLLRKRDNLTLGPVTFTVRNDRRRREKAPPLSDRITRSISEVLADAAPLPETAA